MADLALTLSRRIPATQQTVWEVISDIAGCADRISGIVEVEVLTDEPVGVGMRWKETRMLLGRKTTEEMSITAFEPPRRYVVEADACGAHFVSELRCEPDGEGATMLTMTMETTPTSFFARLMKPIAKLTMNSSRKMIERDLDDIFKACVPAEETPSPSKPDEE
jgi:carbon monoxide dehydrogenase subunit G